MKHLFMMILTIGLLAGCGSSQKVAQGGPDETETLDQKNRVTISLLNRIRQLPGIIVRGGVPVFTKTQTDLANLPQEPLYVLNGYIVGNSFRDVNLLVQSIDVKKLEAITGSETAEYGSRGGAGVIKITTY